MIKRIIILLSFVALWGCNDKSDIDLHRLNLKGKIHTIKSYIYTTRKVKEEIIGEPDTTSFSIETFTKEGQLSTSEYYEANILIQKTIHNEAIDKNTKQSITYDTKGNVQSYRVVKINKKNYTLEISTLNDQKELQNKMVLQYNKEKILLKQDIYDASDKLISKTTFKKQGKISFMTVIENGEKKTFSRRYNEYKDVIEDILGYGTNSQTVTYKYTYDQTHNWTKRITGNRNMDPNKKQVIERTISYF